MRALLAIAASCSFSGAALACDCVRFIPGGPNWERDIKAVTDHAAVILDAELVRAHGPLLEPAIVRPLSVLKGPIQKDYRIDAVSDCALLLREPDVKVGQKLRLILYRTGDRYEASRCTNLQGTQFNAAVETACKSSNAN